MLSQAPIRAYIPASNVARARTFYERTLGLRPKLEYAGGVIYECGGTDVFLYPTPNAGTSKAAAIEDYTVEDFDNLFAVNVRAPFFLVQQLLPIMHEGSSIVLLSSLAAHAAVGTLSAYAATKGAVDTLVKHFAAVLGARGIRVNAVAPGVVQTDMSNFTKTDAGRNYTLGMQALKRLAEPDDIAGVVAFLASEEARWITGDTIHVDGGSKL